MMRDIDAAVDAYCKRIAAAAKQVGDEPSVAAWLFIESLMVMVGSWTATAWGTAFGAASDEQELRLMALASVAEYWRARAQLEVTKQ